ncbi:LysR family transcriptional regulator [Chelativorans sp. YIM 93263]|uniref:LysR family transcriptional regulator n=1 Tax=Chelativorans sp. YIM 93263 TaxID=2906648 RepID=UPI002377EF77|nr:LysR family transcriptional regulator [Chelativorans sp. YIM 93263]
MDINCDIIDLRAFIAVMELGHFRRAADSLALSQPALSRRIQKLEETIGAKLFARTTRHVEPTAVGRELLPLVRRLIDEFDQSLFSFRDIGQRRAGLITMACLPTAAFYFLPAVIKRFKLEYPNIRFRIMDLSANDGLSAVSRGEVEFGINLIGASSVNLDFTPLREDPFVLAAHRDHPLARLEKVRWNDLENHSLITVGRTSGNRTLLDTALASAGMHMHWTYETTHLSTSLGLVEAGVGVSVLPRMATPLEDHPIIVVRPITAPQVSRTIGIVRRRGSTLSPSAQRFVDMLIGEWQ